MDFFTHQDRARSRSWRLVLLFALAVIGVVASLNLIAFGILTLIHEQEKTVQVGQVHIYAIVTVATLLLIGICVIYKTATLGGDGGKLAEQLGGRLIGGHSTDNDERKLLNVVEEMSIASGVPVPRVYVMDNERAINAFAAGMTPDQAVIGVTRGCIERLTRDELQGVIAHEFSHILNGDMRMNLRLIGWNFGIMAIAIIGFQLLRSLRYTRVSSNNKDKGGGIAVILAIGLGMVVVGYVGVLFGRLIQAAISRQREYLADASAVQFTRNPQGIANALKKIGGLSVRGNLVSPHAPEAAHLFFVSGLSTLFATHPPLPKRIRAIDPSFDGMFERTRVDAPIPTSAMPVSGFAPGTEVDAQTIADSPGSTEPIKIELARQTIDRLPARLIDAAHDPYEARAIVMTLLLDTHDQIRHAQIDAIDDIGPGMARLCQQFWPVISSLSKSARLPLFDLCAPVLKSLSPTQLSAFAQMVRLLAGADRKLDAFELALFKTIDHQMLRSGDVRMRPPVLAVQALSRQIGLLLSVLAQASGHDPNRAYQAGVVRLSLHNTPAYDDDATIDEVANALDDLRDGSGGVKRRIVDAATHCILADRRVTVEEAELLRATCAALDVPMPPIVQAQ